MRTIRVRLSESLHRRLEEVADREGISVEQFVATAAAEKMSALLIEKRASRAGRKAFEDALAAVPDVEPAPEDRLPPPLAPDAS